MNHSRTGRIQAAVLGLLAVGILAAIAAVFLLGPDRGPSGQPLDGEPEAAPELPDPGNLSGEPAVQREEPTQPVRTDSTPALAADEAAAGAAVIGQVVDEQGAPIAGALVWISERWQFGAAPTPLPTTEDPAHTRLTDAEGKFRFDRLAAGAEMNLWANHRDYSPRLGPPFSARDEVQVLPPLVLERGATIAGVTQDAGGNPVSARVELIYQDNGNFRAGTLAEQREQDLRLGRLKVVQSEYDGRFAFANVGTGSIWSLRARAEGYATAEKMPVMIQPGKPPEPQLLVLGTEHVIAGVVLSDENQPLGGATITVSRTQPRPVFTEQGVSEPDGSFTLRGLPEGIYGLAAVAEGYAYASVKRIEVDAPPIQVMLSRKGGVAGRVTGPDGAPLSRFRLELFRTRRNTEQYGATGLYWDVESADGAYRVEGLDSGAYVLLVRADGACPTYSPGFQIGREVVLGMDVQLRGGGQVYGRVLDAAGQPLAGAEVSLHGAQYQPSNGEGFFAQSAGDPDNVPETALRTGADGRFLFEHAYPGALNLQVRHATHLPELVPVAATEGGSADVGDLRLYAGGSISGVALDQHGKPLAGGTVSLTREDGGEIFHTSLLLDARGSFRFTGLRAGTYELFAFPNVGDALWFPPEDATQRVYVVEGKQQELELRAAIP